MTEFDAICLAIGCFCVGALVGFFRAAFIIRGPQEREDG